MGRYRRDKVKKFDAVGFRKELRKTKELLGGEIDHLKIKETVDGPVIPPGFSADHQEFLQNLIDKHSGK